MPHASNIVHCDGPDSPHAFDMVAMQPRNGALDARCPKCRGHGCWNAEIDLVSFRCRREICDRCFGAGWVETGNDPVALPNIELGPEGKPRWTVRYLPKDETLEPGPGGSLAVKNG